MAQWGKPRLFTDCDGSVVEALPTVDMGHPFAPLASEGAIVDLTPCGMLGPRADILLADAKRRFVGKPYREWENGQ